MADVKIAIKRVTLPETTANTVDCTESGFGTVKAAIVFSNYKSFGVGQTAAASSVSIGVWDGTNMRSVYAGTDNERTTTDSGRGIASTRILMHGYNQTLVSSYSISNITDGVRLTMHTDGTTAERSATVLMFSGTDVSSYVGSATATEIDEGATYRAQSVGFKPKLIFTICAGIPYSSNTTTTQYIMSIGCAIRQNGIQNRGIHWFDTDATSTSRNALVFSKIYCQSQYYADAYTWAGKITSINTDGFTLETGEGITDSDSVAYLALDLGDYNIGLQDFSTPTSTGDVVVDGLGFKPSHLFTCCARAIVPESEYASFATSFGASDGTTESAISSHGQDNVANSNVGDALSDRLIEIRNVVDSGVVTAATVSSFDDDGYTLNYSDVHGTSEYLGFALAFQTEDDPRVISTSTHKLLLGT